ncbi:MAG: hypothetical protein MMC23_000185 [Stictis urceolatum]|nr:hypothetical protein [Stictis urceolata]
MAITPICTGEDYPIWADSVKHIKVNTSKLTMKGFIDLLEARKYDRYQFSPSGQGCRYWIYMVIRLLDDEKLVTNAEEVASSIHALDKVGTKGGVLAPAAEQTPMTRGTFDALT